MHTEIDNLDGIQFDDSFIIVSTTLFVETLIYVYLMLVLSKFNCFS
uniref:Uncharacterized protein n=1 Tax=Rhizophora mucronata TaxID=61149 RepID=A0A2P2NCT6_RHIMU